MCYKKLAVFLICSFFSLSIFCHKPSMQEFYDKNWGKIDFVVLDGNKFSKIKPLLEKFVNDGGNILEPFYVVGRGGFYDSYETNLLEYAYRYRAFQLAIWILNNKSLLHVSKKDCQFNQFGRRIYDVLMSCYFNDYYVDGLHFLDVDYLSYISLGFIRFMLDWMPREDRDIILKQCVKCLLEGQVDWNFNFLYENKADYDNWLRYLSKEYQIDLFNLGKTEFNCEFNKIWKDLFIKYSYKECELEKSFANGK
jgi:hypothetical protein